MTAQRYTTEEIVRRGENWYQSQIRTEVEKEFRGQFLAVDIETGLYGIGPDGMAAATKVRKDHPGATLYFIRIGSDTAFRVGAGIPASQIK